MNERQLRVRDEGVHMTFVLLDILLAVGLFLGMLAAQEVGRYFGMRRLAMDPERGSIGTGAIEGALFALLGLLIAFTFSGAAQRFDTRRLQIVEEANAIGTAYLRLDLLPDKSRNELRERFRKYLDVRLDVYRKLPDLEAAKEALAVSATLQSEIWSEANEACRNQGTTAPCMLLLPALNQMIDITTTRTMAAQMHPPRTIFILLFGLSLVCSLMSGYGMAGGKTRSWTHLVAFAAVMAITVNVIIDIEYPRLGLIQLSATDQVLVDLRASMK